MTAKMTLVRREFVGKRLRAIMDAKGWSQVQAAARFRVSQQTIKNWLGDYSRMMEMHLRKLEGLERSLASNAETEGSVTA